MGDMPRWSWTVEALSITGFSLLFAGVIFEQAGGLRISAILVVNGMLAMSGWLALRGQRTGSLTYRWAWRNVVLSIYVMTTGCVLISVAELDAILFSASLNITLFLVGIGIFILGIAGFVASLIFAAPTGNTT